MIILFGNTSFNFDTCEINVLVSKADKLKCDNVRRGNDGSIKVSKFKPTSNTMVYGVEGKLLVYQNQDSTKIWYNGGIIQVKPDIISTCYIGFINNTLAVLNSQYERVYRVGSYDIIGYMTEAEFRKQLIL